RRQEEQREERDPRDLAVHERAAAVELARFETRSSRARSTKLATTEDPPYETNGRVIPVSGIRRRTPPTMMNVCSAKPKVRPAARSLEKPSSASSAIFIPRATKSMNTSRSADAP